MKDKITGILYNHFGWQRKVSIEKAISEILALLAKEEPEGVTVEEILKDEQSTYTWNLICKTPVAYGSDIMLKDWIVQAMESYASSKQIDLRCKSCGEPLSGYCERCQHLWET